MGVVACCSQPHQSQQHKRPLFMHLAEAAAPLSAPLRHTPEARGLVAEPKGQKPFITGRGPSLSCFFVLKSVRRKNAGGSEYFGRKYSFFFFGLAPPTGAITTHDGMFVISLEARYLVRQLSEFLVVGLLFEAAQTSRRAPSLTTDLNILVRGGPLERHPTFPISSNYLDSDVFKGQTSGRAPSRPTFSLELVNLNKKK